MYKKNSGFLIILLGMMLFLTNCELSKTLDTDLIYQGTVYDSKSNTVPGVLVNLRSCAGGPADYRAKCANNLFDIGSATTDAWGHFTIKAKESRIDDYYIFVNGVEGSPFGVSKTALPTILHIP